MFATASPAVSPRPLSHARELSEYADRGETLAHSLPPCAPAFRLSSAYAAAALISGHSPLTSGGWSRLLYTAQVVLVAGASAAAGFGIAGALASAALFAWLPPRLTAPQFPQSLYAVMVLVAALLVARRARRGDAASASAAALGVGATFLFRSTLAFLPPLLALSEAIERGPRARRRDLLILALTPYLFTIPTLAMNWRLERRVIPFENGAAAMNIATGALGTTGTGEGLPAVVMGRSPDEHPSTFDAALWAARRISASPGGYAAAVGRRASFVFRLAPWLWILSCAALWAARARAETRALAVVALYYTGIHCVMSVQEDYFVPLWPLLCVLAAAPLASLAKDSPATERLGAAAGLASLIAVLALDAYAVRLIATVPPGDCSVGRVAAALDDAVRSAPEDAWLRSRRGRERFGAGDFRGAADDFAAAARTAPGHARASLGAAAIAAASGDGAPLRAWLAAEEGSGRDEVFEARVHETLWHLAAGRRLIARAGFAAALEARAAGRVPLRFTAGEREREIEAALAGSDRPLEAAWATSRGWPRAPRAELLALLEEAGLGAGAAGDAWLELARAAFSEGDRPAARAYAAASLRADSQRSERTVALLQQDAGDYSPALALFRRIAARNDSSAEAHADLGVCLFLAGRAGEAAKSLRRALELDPSNESARRSLGVVESRASAPRR